MSDHLFYKRTEGVEELEKSVMNNQRLKALAALQMDDCVGFIAKSNKKAIAFIVEAINETSFALNKNICISSNKYKK